MEKLKKKAEKEKAEKEKEGAEKVWFVKFSCCSNNLVWCNGLVEERHITKFKVHFWAMLGREDGRMEG